MQQNVSISNSRSNSIRHTPNTLKLLGMDQTKNDTILGRMFTNTKYTKHNRKNFQLNNSITLGLAAMFSFCGQCGDANECQLARNVQTEEPIAMFATNEMNSSDTK